MDPDAPLYGLDIETDTARGGLDPARTPVVAVAVVDGTTERVFTGAEAFLLARLDEHLASLPSGVLVTWNGAGFDLPFLADRAHRLRVGIGLQLTPDPSIGLRREPLAGHHTAYRASWYQHAHIDAYRLYRADAAPALGVSCSLKSMARALGLPVIEVDRTRIHELDPEDLARYVASDARLARALVLRRWATAARSVDSRSRVLRRPAGDARVDLEVAVS
jgi:DNA polymerase elongation subunit (family B)